MQPDLSQLKDIHLPSAINDWPIALGWWILAFLIIAAIVSSIIVIRRYRIKNAPRKAALTLLRHQYSHYKENKNSQMFLQNTNQILKRYCLVQHPHAAGLTGLAWTDFLIRHSQKSFFSPDLSQALSQGLYQKHFLYDVESLYQASISWLKNNNAIDAQSSSRKTSNQND